MSRINETFAELKKRGEAALIPFITAGDPDLATTLKIMRALATQARTVSSSAFLFRIPRPTGRQSSALMSGH